MNENHGVDLMPVATRTTFQSSGATTVTVGIDDITLWHGFYDSNFSLSTWFCCKPHWEYLVS